MKLALKATTAAIVITLGVFSSASASDRSQLIAAAGFTETQAKGLSLSEIAAAKFNRGTDSDARQTVSAAKSPINADPARHGQLIAAAGLTADQAQGLTIGDLAVSKYNVGADADEQQTWANMFTRGPVQMAPSHFITAAGLTPAQATGLSLNEIYALKLAKEGMGNYDQ